MKVYLRLALLACVIALTAPARAETSIAVIDIQKIMQSSRAAVSIQEQIDSLRKDFMADLHNKEEKLRDLESQLDTGDISSEGLNRQKQNFEAQLLEARRLAQARKSALDETIKQARQTLRANLLEVAQDIADENGYDLIISRQDVVIGAMDLDITAETLDRLNERLPKVEIKINQ